MGVIVEPVNCIVTPDTSVSANQGVPTDCSVQSTDSNTSTTTAFPSPNVLGFCSTSEVYDSVLGTAQLSNLVSYLAEIQTYKNDLVALMSQYTQNPSESIYEQITAKTTLINNIEALCQALGATAGTTGSGIDGELSLGSYGSEFQGSYNQYTSLVSSIGAGQKSVQNLTGLSISCTGGMNSGISSAMKSAES